MKKVKVDRMEFKEDKTLNRGSLPLSQPLRQTNRFEAQPIVKTQSNLKQEDHPPLKDESAQIGGWEVVDDDELYNNYYQKDDNDDITNSEQNESNNDPLDTNGSHDIDHPIQKKDDIVRLSFKSKKRTQDDAFFDNDDDDDENQQDIIGKEKDITRMKMMKGEEDVAVSSVDRKSVV